MHLVEVDVIFASGARLNTAAAAAAAGWRRPVPGTCLGATPEQHPAHRPPMGGGERPWLQNGRAQSHLSQNGLSQNGLSQNGLSQNGYGTFKMCCNNFAKDMDLIDDKLVFHSLKLFL